MALQPNQRLGPYEILSAIGAGGMGEVYRAHDGRLNRDVALKVLPEVFAADPDRMARFEREARVLGALNHPNIAAIYGLEEFNSSRALVMELVSGETLADRIAKGPIPVDEALPIAKQLSEVLEYAHDRGVIHRDLKPANIKVTTDGTVKVLDFGLAKALTDEPVAADPRDSPTLSMAPTMAGAILGTAAYMSPEQANGKPVDRRADIWAFGAVLFEMLTGRPLYSGETAQEILAAVMMKEPLEALPKTTSPAIHNLLRRCLEKNPRQRLQHIGEARIALEALLSDAASRPESVPIRPQHIRKPIAWVIAAMGIYTALAFAIVHFRTPTEEARVLKMSILPPEKATFAAASLPALSPDGRSLAFAATRDGKDLLWIRELDSTAARPLTGTEGANDPFWSPDSRSIAFFAEGKLKRIAASGGPALSLCDAVEGRGGSWSKNDVIVFAPNSGSPLFRVPASGGTAIPVTTLDRSLSENSHRLPWFLPDGHHFLYTATSADFSNNTVYFADVDSSDRHKVLVASSTAVYSPPGYVLYLREQTLLAQRFDAYKGQTIGDPMSLAEQIDSVFFSQGQFSSSQNGVLAYVSGISGENTQLVWFDRSGKIVGRVGTPASVQRPAISPDGNILAVDRRDPQTGFYDLWLYDLVRGTASRLTANSRNNDSPIWSSDGSRIAFRSNREGTNNIYQKSSDGTSQQQPLDNAARSKRPDDWSRDGRYLIEEVNDPKTKYDIWILPLLGDRKPFAFLQTEFNERYAKLSPDGRWLAYTSDETKRDEIYVQTFSGITSDSRGKWQISTNGGDRPFWSRDGKELFFIGADQKLMTVDVKGGTKFEAGVPKALFETHIGGVDTHQGGANGLYIDVSKDGRFLIPTLTDQANSASITVVVNWTAGLKK
jgi:eukaryotic-like serine/threonine-protein kinase